MEPEGSLPCSQEPASSEVPQCEVGGTPLTWTSDIRNLVYRNKLMNPLL